MDVAEAKTILQAANAKTGSGATQRIVSLRKKRKPKPKPKPQAKDT